MVFHRLLNGFQLKIIMLILMVFDHIYLFFGSPKELYFAHVLSRVVAPVFTYLMTQGMVYTRSRERYLFRLFAFAAAISLGNAALMFVTKINIPYNIFLSLALGASVIYFVDKAWAGESRSFLAALAAGAVILSYYCEGKYLIPMMAVIFYYLRGNKPLMYTAYALSAGIPYLMIYAFTGRLQTQFYMIFAVIPIMLYNGRRGPDNAFAKYFFYIFYPLHIWMIVLIKFSLSL